MNVAQVVIRRLLWRGARSSSRELAAIAFTALALGKVSRLVVPKQHKARVRLRPGVAVRVAVVPRRSK